MLHSETKRVQKEIGLRDETLSEIASIFVMVVGILLFLALVSESPEGNLIGRLGSYAYEILTFVFGKYVAHLAPVLIIIWGVKIWRGQAFAAVSLRVLGLFVAATSVCAMAAIPYAELNFRKEEGFRVGGALGNFLVHNECMYLKGYLGKTGSYLLFTALLLVSVILMTNTLLRPFLHQAIAATAYLHPRYWVKYLAFWNYVKLPRAFAADDDEEYAEEAPAAFPRRRLDAFRRVAAGTVSYPRQPFVSEEVDAESIVKPLPAKLPVDAKPPLRKPEPPVHGPVDDLVSMAERETMETDAAFEVYDLPSMELLKSSPRVENKIDRDEIERISEQLEKTLSEFGISAQVVQVTQGPTVTRFELQPAAGVKVARILSLENDIAMCMKAESVRIIAPIPGKGAVGLEIPNAKPTPVFLREILNTEPFQKHPSPLAFALGKTISGEPYICDLAKMPHLLIAGTTGSGKSVCLNSIICSILFKMQPELVKFIMIDPKRVELNVYQAIPHLLAPVVCEPRKAAAALTWAIEQMEERYKKLASLGVRNIDGYNAIVRSREPHPKALGRTLDYMPHIVIVIDELADLMIIARNEVEDSIIRLAQMSRAVGMHLIIATQRPSVNVITGIIKANFPSRVAFQVSSKIDSRTILDTNGAEALLGRGDMLFSPGGSPKPIRLQGCYLSDEEVERVADFVRAQQKANYVKTDFATPREASAPELNLDGIDADEEKIPFIKDDGGDDYDYSFRQTRADGRDPREVMNGNGGATIAAVRPATYEDADAIDEQLFRDAVKLILTHRKASVSLLQRKLKIGFARAGRVMDMCEEAGIVGPNLGSKVRDIAVDPEEYLTQMESKEENIF